MKKIKMSLLCFVAFLSCAVFNSCGGDEPTPDPAPAKDYTGHIDFEVKLTESLCYYYDVVAVYTDPLTGKATEEKVNTVSYVKKASFKEFPKTGSLNITATLKQPLPEIDRDLELRFETTAYGALYEKSVTGAVSFAGGGPQIHGLKVNKDKVEAYLNSHNSPVVIINKSFTVATSGATENN